MEDRTRFTIWITEPRVVADGGVYSAYCDELEIASSGVTETEAKKNLEYAVISYCRSLDKAGLLEKRLEEKGINFEESHTKVINRVKLHPVLVG